MMGAHKEANLLKRREQHQRHPTTAPNLFSLTVLLLRKNLANENQYITKG
jgi:hypothetical protein